MGRCVHANRETCTQVWMMKSMMCYMQMRSWIILGQMTISDGNVSDMQIKLFVETTRLHESLKPLLPEDEMFKQTEWFQNQMHNVKGVIHKMEKWVHANREKCIQVVNDEIDDVTNNANEVVDNSGSN